MMQFRMKQSRPITTCGTRQFDSSINHGTSKLMYALLPNLGSKLRRRKCGKKRRTSTTKTSNSSSSSTNYGPRFSRRNCAILSSKYLESYPKKELQRFESLLEEQVKSNNNNPNSCDMPRGASLEKYGLVVKLKNK